MSGVGIGVGGGQPVSVRVEPNNLHGRDWAGQAALHPEITSTDAEIDDVVYALYGITDEERRILGVHKTPITGDLAPD